MRILFIVLAVWFIASLLWMVLVKSGDTFEAGELDGYPGNKGDTK